VRNAGQKAPELGLPGSESGVDVGKRRSPLEVRLAERSWTCTTVLSRFYEWAVADGHVVATPCFVYRGGLNGCG